MTTSGIYVTTLTFTQLLTDAMVDLGILDAAESPSAAQVTVGMRKFNNLLFQLKGPKAHYLPSERGWTRETASMTPSASTAAYLLKPSGGQCNIQIPTEIITVLLRNTATSSDTVLSPMTHDEYRALPNKSQTGTPTRWFYEKHLADGTLYVDCLASSTIVSGYTFQITYRQPLEVVTTGAETLDLPNEWNRALTWNLAKELGTSYTVDNETWQRVVAMAAESLGISNNHELENQILFYQCKRDIDDL
jgi:hypothetical protein